MFYFEEFLDFKEINKSFIFYKKFTNIKSIFNEIQSGFVAIFGLISILGFAYSYYQKCGYNNDNNINNNINGLDIMDIDKAKLKLRNGKKLTIGYGLIDNDKIDLNNPLSMIYMLAISLVSIYATHNIINSKTKMICKKCNFQIDTSGGYPEHELMNHYNNLNNKLIERYMKCMHRKNSGFHFLDKGKVKRTGLITSVHSYIDYIEINDGDSNDNTDSNKEKDKDDFNEILNELKYNIIENLKLQKILCDNMRLLEIITSAELPKLYN